MSPALGTRARSALGFEPLLPGLYAWAVTVAAPAWSSAGTLAAQATALGALGGLLVGAWSHERHPARTPLLAIHAFLGGSVATWALMGPALAAPHVSAAAGVGGAVAWGAWALAFGASGRTSPGASVASASGPARHAPARALAIFTLALGVAFAVTASIAAFGVPGVERSLLAQALALAASLALVAASGAVAASVGRARSSGPARRRVARALVPLALLASLVAASALTRW